MPKIKARLDAERFTKYQTVIDLLSARNSFYKQDIYNALQNEKAIFIGKVISELVQDGYLTKTGPKTNPLYSWSTKRGQLNSKQWIDQRVLTATVKRSPSMDRPRERLLHLGAAELKISELLAILIRAGLHGESAMQAGEKLAAFWGDDLEKLSLQTRGELKQISRAIGETAYCQIIAGLELGKRLAKERVSESVGTQKIRNTSDVLAYCKKNFIRLAREGKQEEFHVVLLDEKHKVIKSEQITVGLLNESLAHPREVFKPAIRESASALILIHNHPNGDPTPSQDDKTITRELKKASEILGLRILDHIIISKDKILSMVEEKIL
jgi:DNA repair protein RadC